YDPAEGCRGLDRPRLARLHRALDCHRGALRDPDGRVAGPHQALPVVRHARALHHREDGGRVRRIAVSGLGGVSPVGTGVKGYWERFRGRRPPSRPTPRSMLPFSHAEALGNALGLEGPRETLVMACSSGAASLALAADLIADGVVATALAGGVDALTRICFMGF